MAEQQLSEQDSDQPIPVTPPQSAEPDAAPTAESPIQETVEPVPSVQEKPEESSTHSESQLANDATAQPSEKSEPAIPESPQPAPEQTTVPIESQPSSLSETNPDIQPAPEESFSNSHAVPAEVPISSGHRRELGNKGAIETYQNQNAPTETIIERVRGLNESEKEELFKARLKSLSPKGVSARRTKRQANYNKIIAHLKVHGYIANDEVEKLCKVKDSTARKYLNDLEQQGVLLQIGSRGRSVRYRLMQGNQ